MCGSVAEGRYSELRFCQETWALAVTVSRDGRAVSSGARTKARAEYNLLVEERVCPSAWRLYYFPTNSFLAIRAWGDATHSQNGKTLVLLCYDRCGYRGYCLPNCPFFLPPVFCLQTGGADVFRRGTTCIPKSVDGDRSDRRSRNPPFIAQLEQLRALQHASSKTSLLRPPFLRLGFHILDCGAPLGAH